MTAALGRLKRAVRASIECCGGIDGAGASAGRKRSVAGDWNNLAHPAFPPLDCALALDEVALAQGQRPAILHALAAELGHAAVPLPDAHAGGALAASMAEIAAELGDVARAVIAADLDGARDARELGEIDRQVGELIAVAARMRSLTRAEIEGLTEPAPGPRPRGDDEGDERGAGG